MSEMKTCQYCNAEIKASEFEDHWCGKRVTATVDTLKELQIQSQDKIAYLQSRVENHRSNLDNKGSRLDFIEGALPELKKRIIKAEALVPGEGELVALGARIHTNETCISNFRPDMEELEDKLDALKRSPVDPAMLEARFKITETNIDRLRDRTNNLERIPRPEPWVKRLDAIEHHMRDIEGADVWETISEIKQRVHAVEQWMASGESSEYKEGWDAADVLIKLGKIDQKHEAAVSNLRGWMQSMEERLCGQEKQPVPGQTAWGNVTSSEISQLREDVDRHTKLWDQMDTALGQVDSKVEQLEVMSRSLVLAESDSRENIASLKRWTSRVRKEVGRLADKIDKPTDRVLHFSSHPTDEQLADFKAEWEKQQTKMEEQDTWFFCPEHGPAVVDEDGCCAACGADTTVMPVDSLDRDRSEDFKKATAQCSLCKTRYTPEWVDACCKCPDCHGVIKAKPVERVACKGCGTKMNSNEDCPYCDPIEEATAEHLEKLAEEARQWDSGEIRPTDPGWEDVDPGSHAPKKESREKPRCGQCGGYIDIGRACGPTHAVLQSEMKEFNARPRLEKLQQRLTDHEDKAQMLHEQDVEWSDCVNKELLRESNIRKALEKEFTKFVHELRALTHRVKRMDSGVGNVVTIAELMPVTAKLEQVWLLLHDREEGLKMKDSPYVDCPACREKVCLTRDLVKGDICPNCGHVYTHIIPPQKGKLEQEQPELPIVHNHGTHETCWSNCPRYPGPWKADDPRIDTDQLSPTRGLSSGAVETFTKITDNIDYILIDRDIDLEDLVAALQRVIKVVDPSGSMSSDKGMASW